MTIRLLVMQTTHIISTHILTKRMTVVVFSPALSSMYFNSHPHEEDDVILPALSFLICISTHILTKRMTRLFIVHALRHIYFNSHPHEEDDSFPLQYFPVSLYFNSHPHEEDDSFLNTTSCAYDISTHILTKRMTGYKERGKEGTYHFNSHPHEEDDEVQGRLQSREYISTHILTKRMTLPAYLHVEAIIFQLTSSRRG